MQDYAQFKSRGGNPPLARAAVPVGWPSSKVTTVAIAIVTTRLIHSVRPSFHSPFVAPRYSPLRKLFPFLASLLTY